MSIKIAVLQMTSGIEPEVNAKTLADAAHRAAAAGAIMLFAPEMSAMLDRDRSRGGQKVGPEAENPFVQIVSAAARDAGIWVHLGSLPVQDGLDKGQWRNRSLVIDNKGQTRARYDKLHMFDVDLPNGERWRESAAYRAGDAAIMVSTPAGELGLTICYDLRFASLFDALGAAGAQLVAVPAAFTVPTGEAHWHILLRSRAIEQGCFIIAAAQTGTHEDGRTTFGHSLVVNPWGEVLLDMGSEPGLALVDIELDQVATARNRIAAIHHRKPIPSVTHIGLL
jgi:predicted amidohydrolase